MLETFLRLTCDQCGEATTPVDGAIHTPRDLRGEARDAGWTRQFRSSRRHVDLCPRCSKPRRKGDA